MKVLIAKGKAGETQADYLKIPDKRTFRFRLLKNILEDFGHNAALLIDTNQRTAQQPDQNLLDSLDQLGLEPLVFNIPSNPQKFFGIDTKLWKKDQAEYMIIIDLKGQAFDEKLFEPLSVYDIAVGINQTQPLTNQYGLLGLNLTQMLNKCFEKNIYDSIICTRVKSNFDLRHYIGEFNDEMGL
jgi:hypothetical protein